MRYIILYSLYILLVSCGTTKKISQINSTTSENRFFEGRIIYDLSYVPKTSKITKEQAAMLFGDKQINTVKENRYKSEMNGTLNMTQHYLGSDTVFISTTQSNELLWIDVTRLNDTIFSKEILENVEVINGIPCNLLTITSNKGSFKYYFNTSYKINEQYFLNHKFAFLDICAFETKSIMIKSILDTEVERIELIATDIEYLKIDDREFKLPNFVRKRFPIKYDK